MTPIAFLQFDAGGGIGTGWDIGFIGLGVSRRRRQRSSRRISEASSIEPGSRERSSSTSPPSWPGDWHHIVALADDKLEYQAYSDASDTTPWIWEADNGMDFNGWQLYGSYFLGYQMPIVLDTAGLLLQTQGYVGSGARHVDAASGGWGSDFT